MCCSCVSVISLDTTISSFLLILVESSFHFIISFLNLKVFSPCAYLSSLVFASVFSNQLMRSCGGYSSWSLMSFSNACSPVLSFLVIPELFVIHISLTLPFSWSSSSLIRLVFGFFCPSRTFNCNHCTEGVRGNHSSSFAFRY
jgi:hypothetical protein